MPPRALTFVVPLIALAACREDPLAPQPAAPYSEHVSAASLANSWANKSPMANPRVGLVAAAVDGTVYAIGGSSSVWFGGGSPVRTVEAYSSADKSWKPVAPLPSPRAYLNGAVVINDKIYVTGGMYRPPLIPGRPRPQPYPTKSLFVYNPGTNLWTRKADLPVSGHGGASAALNGKLWVLVNGEAKSGTPLYRYDPGTDTWSQRATAPHRHHFATAAAINGKLYVVGGLGDKTSTADLDVYDPATNSWTSKASPPAGRGGAAGRVINGKLYLAGGLDENGGYSNRLEVYDPATDTWVRLPDLPTARWAAGAAVAGGALYVVGGEGGYQPVAVTETYSP